MFLSERQKKSKRRKTRREQSKIYKFLCKTPVEKEKTMKIYITYLHIALSSMIWLIVIWSVSCIQAVFETQLKKAEKIIKLQSLRDSNQVVSIYLLNNIISTYIYNCKLIICGMNRERDWRKWISEMHRWKTLFIDIKLYFIQLALAGYFSIVNI